MVNPVLATLAQARLRTAPLFVRWCALHGVASCPAAPAIVARFVADCASLGIERLWGAVQDISKLHVSAGLADPTLGGVAAAAIADIAGIEPPRSWPDDSKQRFRSLPYDLQMFIATHEARRDKALRRAQNEVAATLKRFEALQRSARAEPERTRNEASSPATA
ncbi:hypothetical protein [Bradyrhizobium sp. Ce-3]|uniref:hypothetical protein n=1 Tax=Bradyrhizobium sp. Ce-3 TaxID=2913970 RepID=UPI001FC8E66A|nr:hypothetical protein [Bradyrhizobium sp. Ce-3]